MSQQTLVDAAQAPVIAYNNRNWDAATRALTLDFVYDEVGTRRLVRGVAEVISVWKGWAAAFSDSNATIEEAHVSGNTVILEVTLRGTHTGTLRTPGGDIPPTGRQVEIRSCQIVQVADGKAKRVRHYFDMATILSQLGINALAA